MHEAKAAEFVRALLDATEAGKVKWEDTAIGGCFRAFIGDSFVKLQGCSSAGESFDEDNGGTERFSRRACYRLIIFDELDELVEKIERSKGDPWYESLERLYVLARRRAKNTDQLLDKMTKLLQHME